MPFAKPGDKEVGGRSGIRSSAPSSTHLLLASIVVYVGMSAELITYRLLGVSSEDRGIIDNIK